MKVPAKTKMTMLKTPLAGNPLQPVERLGYTPKQYQAALDKLEQKTEEKNVFCSVILRLCYVLHLSRNPI